MESEQFQQPEIQPIQPDNKKKLVIFGIIAAFLIAGVASAAGLYFFVFNKAEPQKEIIQEQQEEVSTLPQPGGKEPAIAVRRLQEPCQKFSGIVSQYDATFFSHSVSIDDTSELYFAITPEAVRGGGEEARVFHVYYRDLTNDCVLAFDEVAAISGDILRYEGEFHSSHIFRVATIGGDGPATFTRTYFYDLDKLSRILWTQQTITFSKTLFFFGIGDDKRYLLETVTENNLPEAACEYGGEEVVEGTEMEVRLIDFLLTTLDEKSNTVNQAYISFPSVPVFLSGNYPNGCTLFNTISAVDVASSADSIVVKYDDIGTLSIDAKPLQEGKGPIVSFP